MATVEIELISVVKSCCINRGCSDFVPVKMGLVISFAG